MLRHLLREQIKRVEDGIDPMNVMRDARANQKIPTNAWNTILSPAEAADWRASSFVADQARADRLFGLLMCWYSCSPALTARVATASAARPALGDLPAILPRRQRWRLFGLVHERSITTPRIWVAGTA
jgi:hypothetical protein